MIPPRSPQQRSASSRGMTLVELMVSLTVLVVALGAAMASVSSFIALGDSAREKSAALLQAQDVLEQLHATDFGQVLAIYNDTNADDPAGVVGSAHFDVAGLSPQPTDADGRVGRIWFPVDPATPAVLREDRVDPDFGMPRDLNADGVVDADDHAGDYEVLPVRAVVQWTSASGNRTLTLETILRNQ